MRSAWVIIGSAVRGEERGGANSKRSRTGPSEELPKGLLAAGAATAAAPARKLSPHELWTLGQTPRWQAKEGAKDPSCENAARSSQAVKQSQNRETLLKQPVKHRCPAVKHSQSEETYFATNVPITVRRDGEGYAVSAVHLGKLAEHGLRADGLIVVVPSFIDDVPVVRIASEAFARRFTSGAQVRLVSGARYGGSGGVAGLQCSVSADVVYLGAGVRTYDPVAR